MLLADLRHNAPLSLRGTFVFRGCSLQLLHICTCTAFRHCAHVHIGEKTVHSGDKRVHMYTVEKSLYTVHSGEKVLTATFGPHQITLRPYSAQLSAPGMISYILHCTFHSALFMAFGKMFKTKIIPHPMLVVIGIQLHRVIEGGLEAF